MHPNYEFLLNFAAQVPGKILDYGCGAGEVVAEGLKRGLDICGADVFYDGGPDAYDHAKSTGLLNTRIHCIKQGRLPFPDTTFDLVFHNQVFEHVSDMDSVLNEIARVLRPSGVMLSMFPSKEVWREGHCGIMFAHRLKSKTWLLLWRKMGLGHYHGAKSPAVWAEDFERWLAEWCFYREESAIQQAYRAAGFTFSHREIDLINFRLDLIGKRRLTPLALRCRPLAEFLFKRLAGMVLVSTKDTRSSLAAPEV